MNENPTDAVDFLYRRYIQGHPKLELQLEKERVNLRVAQAIYNLRTSAGLSQRELAKRVGTTASVICRLEDADYEGHSLSLLRRIAAAVNKTVEVRFVSIPDPTH